MNTAISPLAQTDVWRWRFAHVELDEAALELRVAGVPVELEPKPMEFLMCLLRHSGEVVTKDELLEALWTGRVVTESVLTSCVAKLRAALSDDAHKLIRTVHGYGYRLVAEVSRETRTGRQLLAEPHLKAGDAPPLRPQWRLAQAFDGGRGETWLVRHAKTGERRVLKFALDTRQLAQLKREITVQRLLNHGPAPVESHPRRAERPGSNAGLEPGSTAVLHRVRALRRW
jgi:eukaryotic-like serine/threonine-protein kinase